MTTTDGATSLIIRAVQYGDFAFVKESIENCKELVHVNDKDGCSLLHWAAINNRTSIASYLIKYGANVNIQGGDLQETPLHWAVRDDHNISMASRNLSVCDYSFKCFQ